LLYGHKAQLLNVTQMRPDVFNKLFNWLQEYGGLKDIKLLSAAKKLVIFLIIFSNNALYKLLSKITQHSSAIIH
jgi:phosphoserine aminotransferase